MGKGTKKKTVWRTFSFENGYTNGSDDGDTNGLTAHHYQKDGLDNGHDVSNRTAISNGKYVTSWRAHQPRYNKDYVDAIDENDSTNTKFLHSNGNGYTENGHRRESYKRTPLTDKHPVRGHGIRKFDTYFQENGNGNKIDFHDIHENQTMKPSQFRSNRSMKVPVSRHLSHKRWDNRNGNYNSNGILSNYSRGNLSKSLNSDREAANENNLTDEHFNENGLVKNVRNADDSDKCQDKVNDCNSAQQQRSDQHLSRQLNKFNEDEYTRISTPRSEVLFKKGYLMRDKKYVGPTQTISTTATSSNDSGSVSVVSNEETASYYSIQSMSPDNSTYNNGNNSSDSNSATYPNDGFEQDLSLMYSSGFYDNNGYFYVNPYIQNNFDQFVGPTILMPYGSAPTAEDLDTYDADVNTKAIDGEHDNKCNSINSEDMSNSSLSENVSINNDSDTLQTPSTPPPSPLSPNEKPIARSESSENEATQKIDLEKSITDENIIEKGIEEKTDTQIELEDGEKIIETLPNEKDGKDEELPETEREAPVSDNYSMPYFSPFIYVPPMPFVPDARMSGTRRGKFRHHANNYFGRPKRNNRFSRFYNKVYIPTSWSEAPDELAQINVTDEEVVEPKLGDENVVKTTAPTPTIEQCDKILQNSKLNLNVSEFIPQNKRIIFVPLPITPSPPPASVYFVPIPSTESTLNVNVPEFLPKNYKPLNAEIDATNDYDEQKPASTANNATEMMTIKTNESIENQNETTKKIKNNNNNNNHIDGLGNNTKCMQTIAPDNQQHKLNDCVYNAKNENKQIVTAPIKQNGVTVTMSDLLKNNISDNLNLTASSFNNENSHTNLKADLGNKNVTKNIVKNKIYKNDSYCNDSGSSKWSKLNTSNRNAKTKHAYPKTKQTTAPHEKPCDQPLNDAKAVHVEQQGKIEEKTTLEKPSTGLTYAQMMVPTKSTASIEVKNAADTSETKIIQDGSKVQKLPSKGKLTQNASSSYGRRNHSMKKKSTKENRIERIEKPIESVEWFTIGAKGKKHIASNDSQVAEIAFENESKEEKVNKIAEELQLDIKKDADLAMDIMDSMIVTEEKSQDDVIGKMSKKKRITTNSTKTKKKSGKDKVNKEQKRNRRDTFDIIEPNFEASNCEQKSSDNIDNENSVQNEEMIELTEIEQAYVFDPNVFSVPCNLQMDSIKRSSTAGQSKNALHLSTGKSPRNLINQFDIYQSNCASMENQLLKQEEEMVIKIMQQLNKSFDGTPQNSDVTEMEVVEEIAQAEVNIHLTDDQDNGARENSVERFAINAKPYQNVYASNHFLEHSFGDRNDKSERVVISTDLSSSDQSYVEDVEDLSDENFDTYPVIATDLEENGTQHKTDLEAYGNDGKFDVFEERPVTDDNENDETLLAEENSTEPIEYGKNELQTNETDEVNNLNQIENNAENMFKDENEVGTRQESENVFEETLALATQDNFESKQHELVESWSEIGHESKGKVEIHVSVEQKFNEIEAQVEKKTTHELQQESQIQAFEKTKSYELSTALANNMDESTEIKAEDVTNESIQSISTELVVTVGCKQSIQSIDQQNEQNESICDRNHESNGQISKPMVQIEIHPISDDEAIEQKINGMPDSDPAPISLETEASSNDTASTVPCNQSIISNVSSNNRPWLRIVDTTQLLQQQKKLQQTFPITTAVSLWLNQAQKEKTPEPIFRVPDYRFFSAAAKYKKQGSQTSHSNSSIDLTEDTASITSDKFHINDDEEEDIMNFWESPTLQTPQSPTPPPIAYNSVYGSSINYANLLSNKSELLCNNIIDFDASKVTNNEILNRNKSGFNQNMADNAELTSGIDEKYYRPPPEVCCTIM